MKKRRDQKSVSRHIRDVFWPSMGFYRLARYYKHRMGRLSGSPYAVACGFAVGVAVSMTPFIGFHLLMGAALTWLLRGSIVAMALGTVTAGNPWTFPLIWYSTFKIGEAMMREGLAAPSAPVHMSLQDLISHPVELLLPMTIGSLPLAFVFSAASFYIVRRLVRGYQDVRRARIHSGGGRIV